ncbi:hypothetical protein B5M09_010326 [Aphanomyces astaci]|uniref:Gamma tubulin complex component C-terminal domain-containing protein n=1 Tax=Aphanomyces astaci TaxID=112090 RepID=A0A425DBB7_APHAT|nr:hypothetical protein B5M09_010326 [Aphanomyces astaci]
MDVPALVESLVTSVHGSPNPSLMSLSLRILSSRYGNAHEMEHRANDMLGVTQKILRHLKESSIGYDSKLAVQRFESLNQDFITHAMLHRKAALLTLLLRLSLDTDTTTLYVPPLPVTAIGHPTIKTVRTHPHPPRSPHADPSMPQQPSISTTWHDKHMQQDTYRAAVRTHDTGAAMDIPENVLLQEVLYAFQGIDSKYTFFNPSTDRFEVARHVGVSLPMRDLIRKLTEVGWLFNRVQQFLGRSMDGGVVTQSFHHALKAELSDFYRLLAVLSAQVDVDAAKFPLPDAMPELTLKRLIVWTQDPLDRLRVMAALVDSVDGLTGGALASGIYMYMEHGDPFVRQFIQTILNQVATPVLTMIQQWTLEGLLQDPYGDFIQYLMDLLQPELSKRATQIYRHNLMSVLETALNASNAKFESNDILSRLDVKLHQATSGEEGWDVFALHYKLQAPLNTVIPDAAMAEYLQMFSFLFKVKRVEYSLSTCWGRDMNLVHLISNKLPHAVAIMHRGNLVRSQMIHFTTNLHNYIMFEVLDGSWHSLVKDVTNATHLDALIDAHSGYLERIKANAFILDANQELLRALKGIFDTILTFSKVQEAIYTTAVREGQLVNRHERLGKVAWTGTEERPTSALDATGALVRQMHTIATDFQTQMVSFLDLLKQQALGSDNLPFLTFRLDFNEYYRKSTAPPTN